MATEIEADSSSPHRATVRKSNAVPVQVWAGPEGSTRLSLPDFKTVGT
jgi:hypothetical protein